MIKVLKDFKETEEFLSELAEILNKFDSEAVRLKVLEWALRKWNPSRTYKGKFFPPLTQRVSFLMRKKFSSSQVPENHRDRLSRLRSSSGRPAPSKMLDQLIDDGFFKEHHTVHQVVGYCEEKYAYAYIVQDFSAPLGRAVKSGKLSRVVSEDNHNEYFIA